MRRRRRRRIAAPRKATRARTPHQRRFAAAARACRGTGKRFQVCMRKEMKG